MFQQQKDAQTQKHTQHTVGYTLLTPYRINSNNSPQQGLRGSHRVVCHRANAFIWVGGTTVCVCVLQGLLLAPAAECLCFVLPVLAHAANFTSLQRLMPTHTLPVNMCWIKPDLPTEQPLTVWAVQCYMKSHFEDYLKMTNSVLRTSLAPVGVQPAVCSL